MTRNHVAVLLAAALTLATVVVVGDGSAQAGADSTPVTIFNGATPVVASDPDTAKTELGVQFKASVDGQITGVRFYKGAGNTGTHTGSLWTGTTRTRTGKFTGETASGWQTLTFTTPVDITAGTVYTASYLAPKGRYADDPNYPWPVTGGQFHEASLLKGLKGTYKYGGGYPTKVWQGSNYWVDVNFVPVSTPVTSTSTTATSTTDSSTPDTTTSPATTTPDTSTPSTTATTDSSTVDTSTTPPTTPTSDTSTTPTTPTTVTTTPTQPPTGWFTTTAAGQIIDPAGKEFIPVGVNANGPDWVWGDATIGQSASMDRWKFNTLRVDTCWVGGCPNTDGTPATYDFHTNDNLDGIVSEYTAKKYVIMIANMQYGAAGPINDRIPETIEWWKTTAAKYKDNPYVWFNLANEPYTGFGPEEMAAWLNMNKQVAAAVRSVAPNNIIVMDGNLWSQESGTWGCNPDAPAGNDAAPYLNSGIVNHGQELQAAFAPAVFSVHVYGMWGGGENYGCTPALWDATFTAYVNKVHSLGLALDIGETGSRTDKADELWAEGGSWNAVHMLSRVLQNLPVKIGVQFWHGQGGGGFTLFENPPVGWTVDPMNPPDGATLNWKGQFMYAYAHQVNP